MSYEEAEIIALNALGFLVSSEDRANRFLALTGLSPHDLRAMAGNGQFLAGVVEHLLAHESLLVAFSMANKLDPALPAKAVDVLRGHHAG